MYDCRYWLWLSQIFEPGSIRCDKLLQAFDYNPKAIYEAERDAFEAVCGSNVRAINALCDKSLDGVCKTLDFCEKNNIGILTMDDDKYPSSLLCIDGQPPVIYYKGTIPDFETRFTVSIVGTRRVSPYGSSAAYTIAHDIASAGGVIVSGMALGSDTAAHRGALDAKGTTVAFLGCGIDVVYPKENAYLMEEIISTGAVMTDYPPHARPEGRHFPVRNRLISGVSNGVLVVEAAKKSGALITAQHASKQGKLLYAIPGRIGELNSEGSNNLIIEGARTVTCAADIITDYRLLFNLSEKVNMSGFNQFRTGQFQRSNLEKPYQTPTYNPFASNRASYSNRNQGDTFYDNFIPYKPKKPEALKPEKPEAPTQNLPRYIDLNVLERDEPGTLNAPKPRIIFSDFDDEEHAKAYMSLTNDEKEELERLDLMGRRPVLIYPKGPMPKGGYKVNLTKEKRDRFDRITEEMNERKVTMENVDKIHSVVPCAQTFEELNRLYDEDMRIAEEYRKIREEAKRSGLPDYTGLSSIEISILKLLEGGKRITVDAMSHLGIPLSKLLSVLTVLEIKKRIIQHPGGYFELNRDY